MAALYTKKEHVRRDMNSSNRTFSLPQCLQRAVEMSMVSLRCWPMNFPIESFGIIYEDSEEKRLFQHIGASIIALLFWFDPRHKLFEKSGGKSHGAFAVGLAHTTRRRLFLDSTPILNTE
jgi:hypothetical protein